MILYFSATGNCKYVASRLAEAEGEEAISIVDCIQQNRYSFSDKKIGIISPTYVGGLPSITREFLQKAELDAPYTYYVATYGTTPGSSSKFAARYLGKAFSAYYSVRMVDTWTPAFDLSTPEKVAVFTNTTEPDIDEIIGHIQKSETGDFMKKRLPYWLIKTVYPRYEKQRETKNLVMSGDCIGCGLCARKCPVQAIEMRDKKPVWVKDKCVMCLGCLHRCPKFAIHYGDGKATIEHGQYTNPNVKV